MNSKVVRAYIQLLRPVNIFLTFIAVCLACWLAGATANDVGVVLIAAFSASAVAAGANALNDFYDIEIDRINKPTRPLPSGILMPRRAQQLWAWLSLAAVGASIALPLMSTVIVLFAVGMLYLYSKRWKGTVLLGNSVVAVLTGLTFIYGGSVVGNYKHVVIPAVFAFLTNFARELVKDIEDIEGDRLQNARTLPVRFGVLPSQILITVSLVLVLVFSILVVVMKLYTIFFTVSVTGATVLFCIACILMWQRTDPKTMHTVSTLLKYGMFLGMIGILGGSL